MKTRMMKAIVLTAVVMFAVPVWANDTYRLTTGVLGGFYHNTLGVNLRDVLREKGIELEVTDSKGSVENLERIHTGEADIGFTQADAMAYWLRRQPMADVEIVGSLAQECVFIAVREDSGIDDIQDLANPDIRIAVGNMGSGSAYTWDNFLEMNPDYAQSKTHYEGGVRAMGKVQTGNLDAFLWVTNPNDRNHDYMRALSLADSPLKLVEIDDDSLMGTLPNGNPVYSEMEITGRTDRGWMKGDDTVDSLCTDLLVVADYDLTDRVLEQLAVSVMMNANRITSK